MLPDNFDFSDLSKNQPIIPGQVFVIGMEDKTKGLKYDTNKPRLDLIDPDFITQVGLVLTYGAEKYSAHNWRKGIEYSRLIAAALRHLNAFNSGEDLDKETALPHLAHASCCLMFLLWMSTYRKDLDDRAKQPTIIIG